MLVFYVLCKKNVCEKLYVKNFNKYIVVIYNNKTLFENCIYFYEEGENKKSEYI